MTTLALSRIHFPVTTLGPGRRIGVWFQGCSIRCPGCISLDTWAAGRGVTSVEATLLAITPYLDAADGLTVSGGEPFDQQTALSALLTGWRARHGGDTLVYSGHALEALAPALERMNGLIDALVADPYVEAAGDGLALRGSDNQRMVLLTQAGRSRFSEHALGPAPERAVDLMFDDERGEVFLAGIPRRGDVARLRTLLEAQGHQIATTQDIRT